MSDQDSLCLSPAEIDLHLDAILRASGSSLRNYSLPNALADMRAAVRAVAQAGAVAAKSNTSVAGGAPQALMRDALVELVACGRIQRDANNARWSGMSDHLPEARRLDREYAKRQPKALAAAIDVLDANA